MKMVQKKTPTNQSRRVLIDDFAKARRYAHVQQYARVHRQPTATSPVKIQKISPQPIKKIIPSQTMAEQTDTDLTLQEEVKEENKALSSAAASIRYSEMELPTHKTPWKQESKNTIRQSVAAHLAEMQQRLMWITVALVGGGTLGYFYNKEIVAFLVKPLNEKLYYTSPTGGFDFLIKTCLFFGFLLAIPIIVYHFVRFLSPALPHKATYNIWKILLVSSLLAISGVAFAYLVSLPAALHFLSGFSNDQVESLIDAREYFNFVMIYLAGFAALFQMPLIIAFINKIKPLSPMALMKKQRVVILLSFIAAAILTPTPDPINQTIMAAPIIGLYQVSVGVVWQSTRKKNRRKANIPETAALEGAV